MTYHQALNQQKFDHKCGVKRLELWDDYLIAWHPNGKHTKLPTDALKFFHGTFGNDLFAIVKSGNFEELSNKTVTVTVGDMP